MEHLLRRLFSLRGADSRGIAISLHDDIGQDLALIGLRLSILKKSLSLNKLPDIPTALSELQELILVTHKKTRELECAIYPRVAEISLDTAMKARGRASPPRRKHSDFFSIFFDPPPNDGTSPLHLPNE